MGASHGKLFRWNGRNSGCLSGHYDGVQAFQVSRLGNYTAASPPHFLSTAKLVQREQVEETPRSSWRTDSESEYHRRTSTNARFYERRNRSCSPEARLKLMTLLRDVVAEAVALL